MTNILLFIAISIFAIGLCLSLLLVIVPRYFLRKHRISFDTTDKKSFYTVYNVCKKFHVAATYDELEYDVSLVRFVVPVWKEKKVLGAFRAIESVEVY